MSILLSLTFLLIIMMTFCKKSVHSFLGFSNSKQNGTTTTAAAVLESPHHHYRNIPSLVAGLGFITSSGNTRQPTNIVESATVKSLPPPSSSNTAAATVAGSTKRDPGGIGFLDEVGGSVNGLMSCTESLGFESSDERRIDDRIDDVDRDGKRIMKKNVSSRWKKTTAQKSRDKKFPPPLSSLNHDGKPTFYLRPVRENGRLELTEVKIHRPEILRASRQDGRLRLHLISEDDVDNVQKRIEAEAEAEEDFKVDIAEAEAQEEFEEDVVEEVMKDKVKEKEERSGEWWFPATGGGGDGFRRCNEVMNHHHHHHHHHQNLHFVTIR